MELDFKDKVVIVTGASSGIGAATSRAFAKYGAKLSLVGRNEERLNRVARECDKENPNQQLCVPLDLTKGGSCEEVINKTMGHYGKLDILINCAGTLKTSTLFDSDLSAFDEMMLIHVRVPYLLTKLAVPHLMQTKGCIVNVGSAMINLHKKYLMPYLLSKSALRIFTLHAASELANKGVRINVVSPGVAKTDLIKNLDYTEPLTSAILSCMKKKSPTQELIHPEEVASLILWTCNDELPNVNGSNLVLDAAASFI